ncbi:hypothetical protein AVEN_171630-1 [Araneus ventricosus]|uniref:Uncharacterized protein n=1 Tax=Araneus ventricosus TaxID=182803 RepID=A0A4Y2EZ82_ARAVE|nr:hypothetical protein AVEN_171630-1 [Araneus ventricosus]
MVCCVQKFLFIPFSFNPLPSSEVEEPEQRGTERLGNPSDPILKSILFDSGFWNKPTTRVSHSGAEIDCEEEERGGEPEGAGVGRKSYIGPPLRPPLFYAFGK